jgi:hypothetical protein
MHTIASRELSDSTPICGRGSWRVELSPAGGWDVLIEDDRHVVSIRHCTEWHRVERCTMQASRGVAVQCRRKA